MIKFAVNCDYCEFESDDYCSMCGTPLSEYAKELDSKLKADAVNCDYCEFESDDYCSMCGIPLSEYAKELDSKLKAELPEDWLQ